MGNWAINCNLREQWTFNMNKSCIDGEWKPVSTQVDEEVVRLCEANLVRLLHGCVERGICKKTLRANENGEHKKQNKLILARCVKS